MASSVKAELSALALTIALWPAVASASVTLQPFTHTYAVTALLDGKPVVTAEWHDTLDGVTVAGKNALRRTQVSVQSNGKTRTWVSVFEPDTFAPIADTFSTSDGEIFARTFSGAQATQYSATGPSRGIVATTIVPVPPGYSDFNGGQFGLALLQLPLTPSYKTSLTTFGTTDSTVQIVSVEVLRSETIKVGLETLNTVVVRAIFAAKYYPEEGENFMTFWLTKTPPYVVRLVQETPARHLRVDYDLKA